MDYKLLLSLAFLLALAAPRTAQACSCIMPVPPAEALQQADAVFSGEVLSVEQQGNAFHVDFQVKTAWKGGVESRTVIRTPLDSAACGYAFEAGGEYLVYAWADGDDLQTNLCSRTKLLSEAREDLVALGPGEEVQSGGRCGGPGNTAALQASFLILMGMALGRRRA